MSIGHSDLSDGTFRPVNRRKFSGLNTDLNPYTFAKSL